MTMQGTDATIYVVCLKDTPIRYTARSRHVPIIANSCTLSLEERASLREQGVVFDDENAFYSHLNPWWGELSCIHWILNNAEEENIGNAQYRRNWIETDDLQHDPSGLYMPESGQFGYSLAEQFYGHHSFDGVRMTMEMAATGLWPFTTEEMEHVWTQNIFYGCLMARGPKEHYKRFMGVLLECMIPLWEAFEDRFIPIEGYDRRSIAFIAERVMTGLILYREKFFPDIIIRTAPIDFIEP